MKNMLGGLALVLCGLPLQASANTIYLTRHAEKSATGSDPVLTAEGQVRATNIAATLKDAQVKHIYSTAYQRTQQTAQPLAAYLGLPVTPYDGGQLPSFAQQLRALPDNALVVGHSDTTPELIRQLGGDPGSAIAETEFDRLYQLTFAADGSVTTNLLHSLPSTLNIPCASVTLNQANLTATAGNWLYFTINVPECANTLNVSMSGGSGDGDLYVRYGAQPTANDYTCRPYKTGNAESCPLTNPQAGTWHIGIKSYTTFSGVTLNATAAQ
ncbi:pre-peptidase C-terminal domain-containing protein [Pseudoduganella violaceinigra]|uniref:pre-peptidase C-terminal domain-containing protein n=1 Tax=Pseudoduganella violaceinigra TaxID=246602 RepID=UPI0003F767E8|nr:pre-peptidase C-terminal domain-containing protein [Pseudoduganella violaceinigra]